MDVKFGHDVASAPSKGLYVQEVVVTASRKDGAAFPCHCWTGNEDKKVTVKHVNGYGVTPAHPHIKVSFLFPSRKGNLSWSSLWFWSFDLSIKINV